MSDGKGITLTINAETAAAVQKLAQFFQSTVSGMEKVAAIGAGLLGLRGIESVGHQVLQLGTDLEVLRKRTGGAIADLVILRKQLTENGGSAEAAGIMLNFMQRSIVLAAEEGGPAAKVFTDLHLAISLSQLSALSATEQYKVLGAAISAVENPAKRTEAALKIFGRGSGELASVFSDPKKFAEAFAGPNAFGQVMARSAAMFHEVELSLNRLAGNGKKLIAGLLDEIGPMFEHVFERLKNIDLTEIGQRIGAFATVVINAWKEDKFPEMLGLLVEAGFEIGIEAAKRAWLGLLKSLEFLTSAQGGGIWVALLNGIMTFGIKASEFLLKVLTMPIAAMAAGFEWLYDRIRVGFQHVGNFIRDLFTGILNTFIATWNLNIGQLIGKQLTYIPAAKNDAVADGTTWGAAFARESKVAAEAVAGINKFLTDQLESARAILTINGKITETDNVRLTAIARLNALIEEQMKKRSAEAKVDAAVGGVAIQSRLGTLREIERLQKEKLLVLDRQLAAVETSYTLTNVEKYEKKKLILEQQRDALMAISKALRERAALEDSTTGDQTLGRADTFEKESIGKQKDIGALGADPNSMGEQFRKTLTDMQNQTGSVAHQIADTFKDVIGTAIDTISKGITGLIMGTKTWGQALRDIGGAIIQSVINAIVKMFITWIVQMTVLKLLQKLFHSESNTQASESAAAWTPAATAASIASYGAAAAVGTAAVVAGMAVAEAFAAGLSGAGGGYAEGGYTGNGGRYEAAGIVHRREFVFSAPAVERIGIANLDALHRGETSPGESGGASGGGGGEIHVHNWFSEDAMNQHIKNSPFVEHHIMKITTENAHMIVARR